jgi:release factor glutamine methyltransferase
MTTSLANITREAIEQLDTAGIDNPAFDARLLIGHILGLDRAQISSQAGRVLTPEELARIRSFINRRNRREPVARILGVREFWSLNFTLNEATLEPRPDSETLIDVAMKEFKDRKNVSILDLGTGTGCLLLALLHELPDATGLGLDYTMEVVDQARRNAEDLNLADRATFRMSHWFDNLQNERYNLIISNPPYIPSNDIPSLMPEVRNYDPMRALDGGADGLESYRLLIPQLHKYLKPEGVAIFEVGQGQATAVADLFRQNDFKSVSTHMDHGGVERCVKAL